MFRTLSLHTMRVISQDFRPAESLFFKDQTMQLLTGTNSVVIMHEGLGCRTKAPEYAFILPSALGTGYPSPTK